MASMVVDEAHSRSRVSLTAEIAPFLPQLVAKDQNT